MNDNNISEEEIQYEILEEQRFYLCKHLDPQNHFAYLRSKHLLTADEEEIIKSHSSRTQRAEKFLDILLQKGPMCYKALVDALLKNKTQTFLVTRLNKEFEKKKIRLHNLLTGSTPPDPNANIGVDSEVLPIPTVGSMVCQSLNKVPMENGGSEYSSLTSDKLTYREDSTA
ncbi:B-cell lymphoma/leukemia 10-like isoform X2 [Ostrea edulis]|uniref:B-cell lymphoma/leukemia 10-like isoform X2 n=1 Tax=Ostrea edulis TaxID=37623 RepID=UPI00209551BD|nr:B-cell lymphoma/leukemia 10-like isoform X2 [Ostrea edulis]